MSLTLSILIGAAMISIAILATRYDFRRVAGAPVVAVRSLVGWWRGQTVRFREFVWLGVFILGAFILAALIGAFLFG